MKVGWGGGRGGADGSYRLHRTRSTGLDSLIRLLLGVDCLQPSLINHLFEKLLEFMDNPTGGTRCVCYMCACEGM